MSTETTKKKIKIDNGTEFARVMTDKAVASELATKQATLVSGTNIKTINGNSLLGSGDLPISGGGESVSPTLSLIDLNTLELRTTITEQEKINLEKGLYNQIIWTSNINNNAGLFSSLTPSKLFFFSGNFLFAAFEIDNFGETGGTCSSMYIYGLTIGTKNANNEYPITVKKQLPIKLTSTSLIIFDGVIADNGNYHVDLTDEQYSKFVENLSFLVPIIAFVSINDNTSIPISLGTQNSYVTNLGQKNQFSGICSYVSYNFGNGLSLDANYNWRLVDETQNLTTVHRLYIEKAKSSSYTHFIKITGTADGDKKIVIRFTIQSSKDTAINTIDNLSTLLGNEFELGCSGIYSTYNITGLKKTTDGAVNIIYNNGGAESLLNTTGITLTISDTVKII